MGGKKISIYWPLDDVYYKGVVSSINESKLKPIHVRYRDGDKEWLDLKNEKFSFYEISSDEESESSTNGRDDDDDDAEYKIDDKHNDYDDDIDLDEDDSLSKRKKKRKKLKKRRKKEKHHKKHKKRKMESTRVDEKTPSIIEPSKVVKNENKI